MKKLLVVPIILCHYILVAILFPIKVVLICISKAAEFIENVTDEVNGYYDDYLLIPTTEIYRHALRIMKSDKIIKWINEAFKKLKRGEPVD